MFGLSEKLRKSKAEAYNRGYADGAKWPSKEVPQNECELVILGAADMVMRVQNVSQVSVMPNGNLKYTLFKTTQGGGPGESHELGEPYWKSYYFHKWEAFGISRHVGHNNATVTFRVIHDNGK